MQRDVKSGIHWRFKYLFACGPHLRCLCWLLKDMEKISGSIWGGRMQVVLGGFGGAWSQRYSSRQCLCPPPKSPAALDSEGLCWPQGPKYWFGALRYLSSKVVREGRSRKAMSMGHSAHHQPCAPNSWDSHSYKPYSSAAQKSGLIFLRTSFMGMHFRLAKLGRKDGCSLCTGELASFESNYLPWFCNSKLLAKEPGK